MDSLFMVWDFRNKRKMVSPVLLFSFPRTRDKKKNSASTLLSRLARPYGLGQELPLNISLTEIGSKILNFPHLCTTILHIYTSCTLGYGKYYVGFFCSRMHAC